MSLIETFLSRQITRGELEITFADGTVRTFGAPDAEIDKVRIRFMDRHVPGFIARHPRLGLGEAYMDHRVEVEDHDIRRLITLARRQKPFEAAERDGLAPSWLRRKARDISDLLPRPNDLVRARRNVQHHYDIGDDLYALFLDSEWQYSCAYFTDPGNSLEQAQRDKMAHIAAKLDLKPGQRVLDIGCGWGGLGLYLNRVAGVEVVGVTLSNEQHARARMRAEQAGVADKVDFRLMDYRDVEGPFDRIVSIGMFEHVGSDQFETFFRKCRSLLTPDGVMLLHTIGRYGRPGRTDAFTDKYIFPGGYIPAMSEITSAYEHSRLFMTDTETLRVHYGHTIRHWYDRCLAAREKIIELYDERFFRMWTFYLAGAETVFRYGGMGNYQLQFSRNRYTLPLTRDYIAEAEAKYRALG
ncbi:class I SAM-dependent methyltransferase [Pacificimonas sp. WHA3]|uniref:Class I SAM-dependent methyltransferase n=1 Tax=Pacificimonas pallii TaxID=2827236 RepID=A0ABS6SBF2_9SPHN|nr:cyclopropane-fatty-acyl-phospholipid synthase family protein [Pacificimonas pallii]MBV7255256.1 class I SAM-dependent methyltransferase [Pacificimonas pallii]